MRKNQKTNNNIIELITQLKIESNKHNAPIWRDLAKRLEKSNRNWAEVNISHLKRFAKKNDIIIIPGKLLGAGYIDIPITVVAFNSSTNARQKILDAGGKYISFQEVIKKNPKGTGIKIFSK